MIELVATITPGCTARLTVNSVEEAAQYIWDHRHQADSWEITPDEYGAKILARIETDRPRRETGSVRSMRAGIAPKTPSSQDTDQ